MFKNILTVIFVAVGAYLVCAFVAADFNSANWALEGRMVCAILLVGPIFLLMVAEGSTYRY